MGVQYWLIEYGKVLGGYMFLMFLWPSVVFWDYLKKRNVIFWFSFCVTVQIIIINTVILTMGIFNILNSKLVSFLFYGTFALAIWRRLKKQYSDSVSKLCIVQLIKKKNRD